MLTSRGILVKVNSVMIPGVNDEHLKEVSKVVKAKGAFLHNVMPLIAEAEHGTYYGLMEQPSPTPEQLQALQDEWRRYGDDAPLSPVPRRRGRFAGRRSRRRVHLDKLADMDIDYEAAMQTRQEVRAKKPAGATGRQAPAPRPPKSPPWLACRPTAARC